MQRHDLKFITIFADDGNVTNTDSAFDGMKRFDARTAVLDALKEKGLYRETKDNPMVVPICRLVCLTLLTRFLTKNEICFCQ